LMVIIAALTTATLGIPVANNVAYPGPASSYAYPPRPYSFSWSVLDAASYNDYGHQESSDGKVVSGSYHVVLPDGRKQIVTYRDEGYGLISNVQYEGEAKYQHYPAYPKPAYPAPAAYPAPGAAYPGGAYPRASYPTRVQTYEKPTYPSGPSEGRSVQVAPPAVEQVSPVEKPVAAVALAVSVAEPGSVAAAEVQVESRSADLLAEPVAVAAFAESVAESASVHEAEDQVQSRGAELPVESAVTEAAPAAETPAPEPATETAPTAETPAPEPATEAAPAAEIAAVEAAAESAAETPAVEPASQTPAADPGAEPATEPAAEPVVIPETTEPTTTEPAVSVKDNQVV